MFVSIALDLVSLGTEPGVLHVPQLGLDLTADVSKGGFLRGAGGVTLMGSEEAAFFFQ